jgi:signal transduction histidine kinase
MPAARVRRSIALPIVFGVLAVSLTLTMLVAWNLIFTRYYVLANRTQVLDLGVGFWMILSIGDVFLVGVTTILIMFLVGSVRERLYIRRQDTFLDSVTHELRSPLASVRLSLETMTRHELPAAQRAELLTMMRRDVERLERFIEATLEIGRLEHGERRVELDPVPLLELIERCAARVRQRYDAPAARIRSENRSGLSDPVVRSDAQALEIVLVNLLDNACKYSPEDTEVSCVLGRRGDAVTVEVRDRGVGLSARELKRVFRRFYRVPRPDRGRGEPSGSWRSAGGTGLGLHLAATLTRELGGRLTATSPGEGRGTTFTVELPREALVADPK